ncbi:hypothetical protein O0L34_g916 [Tuta absoluta]|nr:hypothetical protein O0L34_g916 [Tuta absoluta]
MAHHVENGTKDGQNGTNGRSIMDYFDLENMPHVYKDLLRRPKTYSDILEVISNTPLVKLNKIPHEEGVSCDMYAKCEFLNPGGSVKDRIAYRMVLEAEQSGRLIKGKSVIIEPTSGNTGIGLALAAAVRGYRCIIVLPEKMSDEKVNTLRALGAEIIRTPTEAPSESPESNIGVAKRLSKEIDHAVILDQYNNPCNPLAHYDGTAEEILWALDDKVDMVVIGAGTSGTVSGVGHKIKQRCPNCVVVGVDPHGSILAYPPEINDSDVKFYEVEGLGYDFLPSVLDRSVVDRWVKTDDVGAFKMSRRLVKDEGLLAGGSSGSAMWAACQAARTLSPGQKCVVLLPDGIRNYMTKFISDQWMEVRDLKKIDHVDQWWWDKKVPQELGTSLPAALCIDRPVSEAFALLKESRAPLLPIMNDNTVVGIFTADNARRRLANLKGSLDEPLEKFIQKKFYSIELAAGTTLGRLSRTLDIAPHVVVIEKDSVGRQRAVNVITSDDFVAYVTFPNKQTKNGN